MHEVRVEALLLSLLPDGRLGWRCVDGTLPRGQAPDATAATLAASPEGALDEGSVVHSTSWRPTRSGIVLTYAVVPDPAPWLGTVHVVDSAAAVVSSGDPAAPSPGDVPLQAVIAHACRHLSLVARTDAAVAAAAERHPRLWDAVLGHVPGVAGLLGEPLPATPTRRVSRPSTTA